jgi:hypothetical protein
MSNGTPITNDFGQCTELEQKDLIKMEAGFIAESVPVLIDSMKRHPDFRMARCNYLSIESDMPMPGWHLRLGKTVDLPFLMIGLSGIIYHPIGSPGLFDRLDKIDSLYAIAEEQPGFYIDTNDIWIPDFLFEKCLRLDNYEDHIFRIGFLLFKAAWLHRNERMSIKDFKSICLDYSGEEVRYSRIETSVFRAWRRNLIEETRRRYQESPNKLKLRNKNKREW